MNNLYFKKNKLIHRFSLSILFAICMPLAAFGAVMSSTNYKIESDSINVGGGLASSTNYIIEDTTGEIATGISSSTDYIMSAGYQQMQSTYIAVSLGSAITMSSMGGITNATSTGNTSLTVVTDSPSGYALYIKATSTPALASGANSFDDYTESSDPDYTFSIASNVSEFGYTVEGNDIPSTFKDDGSSCNTGALNTPDACWVGFVTSDSSIAQKTSANHPDGTLTTLKVQAVNGSAHVQVEGEYIATLVITAISL